MIQTLCDICGKPWDENKEEDIVGVFRIVDMYGSEIMFHCHTSCSRDIFMYIKEKAKFNTSLDLWTPNNGR